MTTIDTWESAFYRVLWKYRKLCQIKKGRKVHHKVLSKTGFDSNFMQRRQKIFPIDLNSFPAIDYYSWSLPYFLKNLLLLSGFIFFFLASHLAFLKRHRFLYILVSLPQTEALRSVQLRRHWLTGLLDRQYPVCIATRLWPIFLARQRATLKWHPVV